jgi:hypothetical protein
MSCWIPIGKWPVATKPTKASSVGFDGCIPGHFQEAPSPADRPVPIMPILESIVLEDSRGSPFTGAGPNVWHLCRAMHSPSGSLSWPEFSMR